MRGARIVMLVSLAVMFACGGVLSDAKSAFRKGRYPEAHEMFVRMEPDFRGMGEGRRAEYALYRGLTHGALGDRAEALVWLQEAKTIEDANPGSLSADDRARMRLALESYDAARSPAPSR